MKKLIFIVLILILPLAAFAEIRLGPTALYNHQLEQVDPPDGLHITDFVFGADFRAKISLLRLNAVALYVPGYSSPDDGYLSTPGSIDIYTNAGVAFDILLFRLGIGAGPSLLFDVNPATERGFQIGANVRATADVLLGPISVGLGYLLNFPFDFSDPELIPLDLSTGSLGVSVLFKL